MSSGGMQPRAVLRWSGLLGVVALSTLVALGGLALPARVRIPPLAPHPAGTPAHGAVFSHLRHAQLSCYMCHPSIFPQAPLGFTHRDMREGRYCGACHDGVEARAIEKLPCQECHAEP